MVGPGDWRVWRELRLAALAEAPGVFSAKLSEWTGPGDTETRWRAWLTEIPFTVIVWWQGIPAGMAGAFCPAADRVELVAMWVAPVARGHGVGDAVVEAVVRWAGDRRVGLVVNRDNRPAIRLYERHGFADTDLPTDHVGEKRMLRPHDGTRCATGVCARHGRPDTTGDHSLAPGFTGPR